MKNKGTHTIVRFTILLIVGLTLCSCFHFAHSGDSQEETILLVEDTTEKDTEQKETYDLEDIKENLSNDFVFSPRIMSLESLMHLGRNHIPTNQYLEAYTPPPELS